MSWKLAGRAVAATAICMASPLLAGDLHLNDQDYFETQGLSIPGPARRSNSDGAHPAVGRRR